MENERNYKSFILNIFTYYLLDLPDWKAGKYRFKVFSHGALPLLRQPNGSATSAFPYKSHDVKGHSLIFSQAEDYSFKN